MKLKVHRSNIKSNYCNYNLIDYFNIKVNTNNYLITRHVLKLWFIDLTGELKATRWSYTLGRMLLVQNLGRWMYKSIPAIIIVNDFSKQSKVLESGNTMRLADIKRSN